VGLEAQPLEGGLGIQGLAGHQHPFGLLDQDPAGQRVAELADLGLAGVQAHPALHHFGDQLCERLQPAQLLRAPRPPASGVGVEGADHDPGQVHRDAGQGPDADLAHHRGQPHPARISRQVGHRHRLPSVVGGQAGAFPEVLLHLLRQLRDRIGGHDRSRVAVLVGQHQPDPIADQDRPGGVD
jgi:hypothetical protein